jgi:hypothetical protein
LVFDTDISEEYAGHILKTEVLRFRGWQVVRNVVMRLGGKVEVNKPDSGQG